MTAPTASGHFLMSQPDPRMSTALPLVLYDSSCGLCAASVTWLLRRDRPRADAARFAPLTGSTAAGLLSAHPWLHTVNSVIWLPAHGGTPLVRSEAVLAMLRYLGGPWQVLAALGRLVPRRLRDTLYATVARHRHRLFPARCLVPAPEWRPRFLD